MLGGNLSTLYTYEFRDQLPVSPFLHVEPSRYPTLIDIHMIHKNPSLRLTSCESSILCILRM